MEKLNIILLIALCFIVKSSIQNHHKCSKNFHFDYILLATQWPEAFCEQHYCVQHQDRWLIHGSWPENHDGSYPSFCCTKHRYNHSVLKPIESELIANWKTLKFHGSNDEFWSHEYSKHGTCAVECPLMKDEFHYFKSTLEAFKKLHIEKWLTNYGIFPSKNKTYSLNSFHQAIQKEFGHKVQIECTRSNKHEYPIIFQINFCLSKQNLEPIDCTLKDHKCTGPQIGYLPTSK